MSNYIMSSSDSRVLKTNLMFGFRFPFFKTIQDSLDRFHELQTIIDKIPKIEENRNTIFGHLNECDYILNTLEGYDS